MKRFSLLVTIFVFTMAFSFSNSALALTWTKKVGSCHSSCEKLTNSKRTCTDSEESKDGKRCGCLCTKKDKPTVSTGSLEEASEEQLSSLFDGSDALAEELGLSANHLEINYTE